MRQQSLSLCLCAGCAALALVAAAVPLSAQSPAAPPAELRVRVTEAGSGAPVSEAEVWLGHQHVSSDTSGVAVLALRRRRETLLVRRLGFDEQRLTVDAPGELAVALVAHPLPMGRLAARSRPLPRTPALRRFYERVDAGRGRYLTREQIEQRHPRRLTDLFREIPGVRIQTTNRGERLMMDGATPAMYRTNPRWESGDCPVQYYLDGVSYQPDYAGVPNDVRPNEVEGIEIYRRLPEVPVEFRRPGAECGVVLIWLRERA